MVLYQEVKCGSSPSLFLKVVGFGYNGEENYIDCPNGPFPAIR